MPAGVANLHHHVSERLRLPVQTKIAERKHAKQNREN